MSLKIIFAAFALVTPQLIVTSASASPLPFRIVIDPGHGGQDQGAIFSNGRTSVAEKTVTLMLAQEAARQLRARGFSVVLTREFDMDLPLPARTATANRLGADVFLSIHMNSTAEPGGVEAEGIETYILNNATDASSKRLAHIENTMMSARGSETNGPTDVSLILKDLQLDANLSESKRLACSLQENLIAVTTPKFASGPQLPQRPLRVRASVRNRGIKQALFYVLLGADMPSVLVEAGFLSSPKDRARVLSPQGRRAVGMAIAQSMEHFRRFKDTHSALASLSKCKVN